MTAAPVVSLSLSVRPSCSRRYNSGTVLPAKISRAAFTGTFDVYHISIVLAFESLHRCSTKNNLLLADDVSLEICGYSPADELVSFCVLNFERSIRETERQNLEAIIVA